MKKISLMLLLVSLLLLFIGCSVQNGGIAVGGYVYEGAYTVGGGKIAGSVDSIDISWIEGMVTLAYHDGTGILLSETASGKLAKDEELRWQLDGNTLRVKYAVSGFQSTKNLDKKLTVLLPEDFCAENVDISVVSAEIQMDDIAADTVRLESVSGSINADGVQTDALDLSTVSGDATLRLSSLPDRIRADSVSGDVAIFLPENAGFTAEISSVSGDVSGNLPMERSDKKRYIAGDGRCQIHVETVSGNVQFNMNDR